MKLIEKQFPSTKVFLFDAGSTISPVQSDAVFSILKHIKNSKSVGYAGFIKKADLQTRLADSIFDSAQKPSRYGIRPILSPSKIISTVDKAAVACQKNAPIRSLQIFAFPTFSKFVKKNGRHYRLHSLYRRHPHLYPSTSQKYPGNPKYDRP